MANLIHPPAAPRSMHCHPLTRKNRPPAKQFWRSRNLSVTCKKLSKNLQNLKFHLWGGPTFKKLQKLVDRDQPSKTWKNLKFHLWQGPTSIYNYNNFPIWNQCWWRVWSNEALDRIKGSWTKQDTLFCNLKTPNKTSNKTSQFENRTMKPVWNVHKLRLATILPHETNLCKIYSFLGQELR